VNERIRLRLLFYLLPVVGLLPAVVNLLTNAARSRWEREVSRNVIAISGLWLVTYLMCGGLAQQESLALPALVVNSVLTSGYFLFQVWWMVRVWRGQPLRLPGMRRLP
jgi:hypothetical protein